MVFMSLQRKRWRSTLLFWMINLIENTPAGLIIIRGEGNIREGIEGPPEES